MHLHPCFLLLRSFFLNLTSRYSLRGSNVRLWRTRSKPPSLASFPSDDSDPFTQPERRISLLPLPILFLRQEVFHRLCRLWNLPSRAIVGCGTLPPMDSSSWTRRTGLLGSVRTVRLFLCLTHPLDWCQVEEADNDLHVNIGSFSRDRLDFRSSTPSFHLDTLLPRANFLRSLRRHCLPHPLPNQNVTNPTLLGVIPNGNAFVLPILDSPWEWPVNVVGSDAQYILAMLDDGYVSTSFSLQPYCQAFLG